MWGEYSANTLPCCMKSKENFSYFEPFVFKRIGLILSHDYELHVSSLPINVGSSNNQREGLKRMCELFCAIAF
jgi:hypothetical protein